jgi:predicted transcriptional regulator
MVRSANSIPPLAETRALLFLIKNGPSTVREYFENGSHVGKRAYTTVMSVMDVLHTKRLATRASEGKKYRYTAAIDLTELQNTALIYVLDHYFDGSLVKFKQAVADLKKVPKSRKR